MMKKNNQDLMRLSFVPMMVLSLFICYSCTSVEYGYIDKGDGSSVPPGKTNVQFRFDIQPSIVDAPDMYVVAMSRIVNELHYVETLGHDGNLYEDGSYDQVDNGTEEEAGTVPERSIFTVNDGDYYMISFGSNGNYEISDIEAFRDNSVGMKNLYAVLPALDDAGVSELYDDFSADFNPSYPVISSANPLFLSIRKVSLNTGQVPVEVVFAPEELTVNMRFKVRINVEDGVDVRRVLAEISGIPSSVQLMSGIVDNKDLCKVAIKLSLTGKSGNQLIFEGSARTLGIFTSDNTASISGPGILRLYISASSASGEKNKSLYAGFNLKTLVEEASVMLETENSSGYRAVKDNVLFEMPDLIVNYEKVIGGKDDAVGEWFEYIDVIEGEI